MELTREMHKQTLVQLGQLFGLWGTSTPWPGFECGLNQEEFDRFDARIEAAFHHNGWFDAAEVRRALRGLSGMLEESAVSNWLSAYPEPTKSSKSIGLIFAGNIPLVGLHDLLCVLASGHSAQVKLSTHDTILPAGVIDVLTTLQPAYADGIQVLEGQKMQGHDAVIATGSNNTSRYFAQYFGNVPHVIRQNRNSVAIVDADASEEELRALGEDIFAFYGLGCRSVSKVYFPEGFEKDRFFNAIFPLSEVVNHNKYANNYDYIKSIWLLNEEDLLDNGFVLLKQDQGLASPTGSLFWESYADRATLQAQLNEREAEIQCVVARDGVPFGKAQQPELSDYADRLDTMAWLHGLG